MSVSTTSPNAIDSQAFRRCLGQFATGVTVITAQVDDQRVGITANSFSSLSLDPPLILWSIKRDSPSLPLFRRAKHFAVNVLSDRQITVSQAFSRPHPDKFSLVSWIPGEQGSPLIDGAIATFECSTEVFHDGGDHLIMVGRVHRFAQHHGQGLLFARGRYGVVDEHPDARTGGGAGPGDVDGGVPDNPLTALLFQAYHFTSQAFDTHRRAQGLNLAQTRVLRCLQSRPQVDLDDLAKNTFLGEPALNDAIHDLIRMGCAIQCSSGAFEITADGSARMNAIRAQTAAFEAEYLMDIAPSVVHSGRRFLERLAVKRSA